MTDETDRRLLDSLRLPPETLDESIDRLDAVLAARYQPMPGPGATFPPGWGQPPKRPRWSRLFFGSNCPHCGEHEGSLITAWVVGALCGALLLAVGMAFPL